MLFFFFKLNFALCSSVFCFCVKVDDSERNAAKTIFLNPIYYLELHILVSVSWAFSRVLLFVVSELPYVLLRVD